MQELVPMPERGRRFVATRRVRWGDSDRRGRLRLDGLARYLQDVGNDDTRDVGVDVNAPWVVRRTTILIDRPICTGELVTLTTFCGGIGSRFAERRTSIVGDRGGRAEAAALWVFVDPESGRPARLDPYFVVTYGEAAAGRTVSARLACAVPPTGGSVERRPWSLRSTDFDGLGHVNNAATWEAVEDELTRRDRLARAAELEYPGSIEFGDEVELVSEVPSPDRLLIWLLVDGSVRAATDVTTAELVAETTV